MMPKVGSYSVVVGDNSQELVRLIRDWIERGWQPQGGISVYTEDTFSGPRNRFAQAVVKYETTPTM